MKVGNEWFWIVAGFAVLMTGIALADEGAVLGASEAEVVCPKPALVLRSAEPVVQATAQSIRVDTPVPSRGLAGRRIATEAAHGKIWYTNAWIWQRSDWFPGLHAYSSLEDCNSARMMNRWLLPYLENAGAVVFNDRCRDEQRSEVIVDPANVVAPHEATGPWQVVAHYYARGGQYLMVETVSGTSPTAVLRLRADIPASGYYGITVWYPATAPASVADARYTIIDGAGNRHGFQVNQSLQTAQWVWLGRLYFEAGTNMLVAEVDNLSTTAGKSLAFDALRLGGGMGSENFGGSVSGVPRWQECAVNWTKYAGAPLSVWSNTSSEDYGTRFYYANYVAAEIFVRLHTNGSTGHTGYGSEVYQYTRNADEKSRMALLYPKIIGAIRKWYAPTWRDRGVKANGSSGWNYPYLLVELAFHDYLTDAHALMDAKFRRAAMRGYYEGVVDYLTSGTGVYSPEPPEAISVRNVGNGMARVSWCPSPMGGTPAEYRVYTSPHPQCFCDFTSVSAEAKQMDIPLLPDGRATFVQMRAVNEGGISFPTETLAAAAPSTSDSMAVLIVNGFDRFDWDIDENDNRRDFSSMHVRAILGAAASLGLSVAVDSCANEAVAEGALGLNGYRFVDWLLGQESTADDTLTTAEQAAVAGFRDAGGSLLISGTDLAFDLGNSAEQSEKNFLDMTMLVGHASKTTETLDVKGVAEGPFDGIALTLDDGTGDAYRVLTPDVLTARNGSVVCFTYGASNSPAAVCQALQGRSLFCLAFPFEAIRGQSTRQLVMARILPTAVAPALMASPGWELYE